MILFRKRTIRLVPFYLLYMAAVLAASSLYELYAAESGEIVAQVFGDRVYDGDGYVCEVVIWSGEKETGVDR